MTSFASKPQFYGLLFKEDSKDHRFGQSGSAIASFCGKIVTGIPFCHCTTVISASTRHAGPGAGRGATYGLCGKRPRGSLSSQRSRVVGLIVPSISNSLYAQMAQAIADMLSKHGLHLLIASSGHDSAAEEAAIAAFLGQRVCALILHSTRHTARATALVKAAGIPAVEIGQLTRTPLDLCVSYSGFKAAKAMVMHLGSLGYRRIGFVTLPVHDNERSVERRRGYRAALKELGLPEDPAYITEAEPGFAGGVSAVVQLIERAPDIDAIFFAADVMAVGALFECQRRGWAVPDRLAIASFDDVDLLTHVAPTITTLRIPREEIGRRSARCWWRG